MEKIKIERIVSKAFGGKLAQNTFVVSRENCAIIFDAGTELKDVLIATNGLKVLAIFITHSHFDHIAFLEDYVKIFDCKVYMAKNGIKNLNNSRENLSDYFTQSIVANVNSEKIVGLKNGDKVKLENFLVECFSTPGHSYCSMCYLLENNLLCGDSAFAHRIPRTDFHSSSEKDLQKSLKKISNLNFQIAHAGHGRDFSKEEHIENINFWI